MTSMKVMNTLWGQLGDGTTVSSNVPVKVRSVGDMRNGKIIDIFAAQFHSCVLTEFSSRQEDILLG